MIEIYKESVVTSTQLHHWLTGTKKVKGKNVPAKPLLNFEIGETFTFEDGNNYTIIGAEPSPTEKTVVLSLKDSEGNEITRRFRSNTILAKGE